MLEQFCRIKNWNCVIIRRIFLRKKRDPCKESARKVNILHLTSDVSKESTPTSPGSQTTPIDVTRFRFHARGNMYARPKVVYLSCKQAIWGGSFFTTGATTLDFRVCARARACVTFRWGWMGCYWPAGKRQTDITLRRSSAWLMIFAF